MTGSTIAPISVREVMELSLKDRVAYFRSLKVMSPGQAALVVYTALYEMKPELAQPFYQAVGRTFQTAAPIETYQLAARYIDLPHTRGKGLENHRFYDAVLFGIIAELGYVRSYVRSADNRWFSGTLNRRIYQSRKTAGSVALHNDHCVLYRPDDVIWDSRYTRGEVDFIPIILDGLDLPNVL